MRIDHLKKATITDGGSLDFSLTHAHLNGLYIKGPLSADVTVRLRTSEGSHILINSMPLFRLAAIARSSLGAHMQLPFDSMIKRSLSAIDTFMKDQHTDLTYLQGNTDIAEWLKFSSNEVDGAVFISLGSVYLQGNDELDITVEASAGEYTLCSYSGSVSPYNLLKYEEINDQNRLVADVERLYCYSLEPHYALVDDQLKMVVDADIQLKDSESVTSASFADYVDVNNSRMVGSFAVYNTVIQSYYSGRNDPIMIYNRDNEVPEDVKIQVTGPDADKLRFINVQRVLLQKKVTQSTYEMTRKLAERIAKLEAQAPEKAKALRHSNEIPKAVEAKAAVQNMEK